MPLSWWIRSATLIKIFKYEFLSWTHLCGPNSGLNSLAYTWASCDVFWGYPQNIYTELAVRTQNSKEPVPFLLHNPLEHLQSFQMLMCRQLHSAHTSKRIRPSLDCCLTFRQLKLGELNPAYPRLVPALIVTSVSLCNNNLFRAVLTPWNVLQTYGFIMWTVTFTLHLLNCCNF